MYTKNNKTIRQLIHLDDIIQLIQYILFFQDRLRKKLSVNFIFIKLSAMDTDYWLGLFVLHLNLDKYFSRCY